MTSPNSEPGQTVEVTGRRASVTRTTRETSVTLTLDLDGSGLVKITTSRANITGAHITRNYRWWTACGIRMSYVDDGLTFGTNHDGGVCIHFAEKVPSPLRRRGHSALTVTVADLQALTTALGGDENESISPEPS